MKKILIVRTDRIGDVVLTLPMADVIKKNFNDCYVAMLVRKYTSELVINHKNVDETILYDDGNKLISFFKMLKIIKSYRFDVAVVAFPRFRIAILLALAKIPIRIGTAYRLYSFLFNRKVYEHRKTVEYHELEYNLNLLKKLSCRLPKIQPPWISPNSEYINSVTQKLLEKKINPQDKIVIVHPGTGGSSRNWSIKNFASLCKMLSELDKVKVVLTGSENEIHLLKELQNDIGEKVTIFAGNLNLMEYSALSKLAKVFVGNSTGPLHIAAATGTAVVGLYPQISVMSAKRWGPYTERKKVLTPVDKPIDCKKCRNNKKCECMNSILVDEVFEAVKFFLN